MIYIAVITLLAISLPSETRAQGVITIDLSYKVVLNPADGSRPPGATNMAIDSAVRAMNAMYETYFRGYRFRRVDPIMQIGSQGDTTGPSRWYNTNFFDDDNGADWKDQMEDEARDDPRYAWNDNATNIYITNGICGGICSFPGDHIIIIGGCAANNGPVQLHEIGHYFDLCHTQGCPCGNCNPMRSGECHTEPGDDNIDDTLPDLQCWDRNNIANWSFGTSYANLSAGQQTRVDNVFFNIMSYHGSITRLTELQLDRWADTANDDRENVRSGRTIFVATELGGLFPNGSSTRPFITVQSGVDEANPDGGDIVLLRPGAYNETLTISKPVTLRATRQGPVAIGASVAPSLAARQSPEEIDAALKKVPGIVVEDVGARLDFAGGGKKQRQ
jgi:hypothetical protein